MSNREVSNRMGVLLRAASSDLWAAVGKMAEREYTSKSDILRRAVMALAERDYPDIATPLLDAMKPEVGLARRLAEAEAELARLRALVAKSPVEDVVR